MPEGIPAFVLMAVLINLNSEAGRDGALRRRRRGRSGDGTNFIHPPGEPLVFCKGLVSVSIRVYPWLNCVFQDQNSNASMNRHDKLPSHAAGFP
jgi:hypothetical protein